MRELASCYQGAIVGFRVFSEQLSAAEIAAINALGPTGNAALGLGGPALEEDLPPDGIEAGADPPTAGRRRSLPAQGKKL
jgi:hypothetical protein